MWCSLEMVLRYSGCDCDTVPGRRHCLVGLLKCSVFLLSSGKRKDGRSSDSYFNLTVTDIGVKKLTTYFRILLRELMAMSGDSYIKL